ncbi:hypothetical protein [Rhizobium laguerreae]|uniref:hypothetical protein n=1 Tax=Rhizobium laguerreae TaxID=1076926 RepID=UPI001C92A3ED|nr:hypothetical protein [Rhizobium laguerreae]MBY3195163.1 hypothetical protein [Rhizobium laguerreae]
MNFATITRPPFDGWINSRSAVAVPEMTELMPREAGTVLDAVNLFRGRILSTAYELEHKLDRAILWHLFRHRQDGLAAFFEDNILRENSFGLDRKIRVVTKAALDWMDVDEHKVFAGALFDAKERRNILAHWPVWLQPLLGRDGEIVDYRPHLTKGEKTLTIDDSDQTVWLEDFVRVQKMTEELIETIIEYSKRDGSE